MANVLGFELLGVAVGAVGRHGAGEGFVSDPGLDGEVVFFFGRLLSDLPRAANPKIVKISILMNCMWSTR